MNPNTFKGKKAFGEYVFTSENRTGSRLVTGLLYLPGNFHVIIPVRVTKNGREINISGTQIME